jgi:hypothetical protein
MNPTDHPQHRRTPRPRAATPPLPARQSLTPTPVCDGCRRGGAIGPWHAGPDGDQYCDTCQTTQVAVIALRASHP